MSRKGQPAQHAAGAVRASTSWIAMGLLLVAWLAFVFPMFAGKVRFPVEFDAVQNGRQTKLTATNPEEGDAYFATFPWRSYLVERTGAGQLPLWDPSRFGGSPFMANIVQGLWYPPNWLYVLTGDVLFSYTAIAVASILGALLLCYWFLRVLRLYPYAASLGAIAFVFSAFLMKWSFNESVFGSSMWLPLALGGMELVHSGRRRALGILLCGLGLALSVLAGHAQMALYVWLATAVWGAAASIARALARGPAPERGRAAVFAVGAAVSVIPFLLGAGLAAIQLLPTAELAGHTSSQIYTFEEVGATALPKQELTTMLVPDYRGNPVDGNFVGPGINYTEIALYAGVVTLPFAAAGLLHRRRRLVAFFAGLVAVGFLAATVTPLYRALEVLPMFNRVFFATRFIFYIDAGLALLAALGLDVLLRSPAPAARVVAVATALALAAVTTGISLGHHPLPKSYLTPRELRTVALLFASAIVVVATSPNRQPAGLAAAGLALLDLWLFGFAFVTWSAPGPVMTRTDEIRYLASLPGPRPRYALVGGEGAFWIPPNSALRYHLYDLGGYDVDVPRSVAELLTLADPTLRPASNFFGPFAASAFSSPIMDLLGVGAAVGPPNGVSVAGGTDAGRFAGRIGIVRRPGAFPPAFLTSCATVVAPKAVLPLLRTMSANDFRTVAVIDGNGAARAGPGTSCGAGGQATVDRYAPEQVNITTSSTTASTLVLTDTWYPGWHVTVDGVEGAVLTVDHALRGVELPPGQHNVVFRYRPASFHNGAALTVLTVILIDAAAILRRRSRRR